VWGAGLAVQLQPKPEEAASHGQERVLPLLQANALS